MPEGRRLDRDDLDAAFPDHPVCVDHVSMHGTVLNSLALKHFGMDANTKPEGGIVVRKPGTNEPWGLIMETAFQPIHEEVPVMTPDEEIEPTKAAHRTYASFGITTAQEGLTNMAQLQAMRRGSGQGTRQLGRQGTRRAALKQCCEEHPSQRQPAEQDHGYAVIHGQRDWPPPLGSTGQQALDPVGSDRTRTDIRGDIRERCALTQHPMDRSPGRPSEGLSLR
jgi:hypothetical protein